MREYSYTEPGYHPKVTCIHNSSSAYIISLTQEANQSMRYAVNGYLPNSDGVQEWARLASYSSDAIVFIGVASSPNSTRRVLTIAAGKNYANLNNTQCTIDFRPALFSVRVNVINRDITVTPTNTLMTITNIEPTGFLTVLANWQFSLMSEDQSRLYSSLVGDSLSQIIGNFITATAALNGTILSLSETTHLSVQASFEAMVDDIVAAYSSAQVMVANRTSTADAAIQVLAYQFRSRGYIITVVILNVLLLAAFVFETCRTNSLIKLVDCYYTSTRDLVRGITTRRDGVSAGFGGGKRRIGIRKEVKGS